MLCGLMIVQIFMRGKFMHVKGIQHIVYEEASQSQECLQFLVHL